MSHKGRRDCFHNSESYDLVDFIGGGRAAGASLPVARVPMPNAGADLSFDTGEFLRIYAYICVWILFILCFEY